MILMYYTMNKKILPWLNHLRKKEEEFWKKVKKCCCEYSKKKEDYEKVIDELEKKTNT